MTLRRIIGPELRQLLQYSLWPLKSAPDSFYPRIQRNRELRGQGMDPTERWTTIAAEMTSGKLTVPDYAMSFHLDGINLQRALPVANVRVPFATPESTGLLTEPDSHRPWLMSAGTAGAHIMAVARQLACQRRDLLMALRVGDRLAHYDVTALIGEGGMGRVYRAGEAVRVGAEDG